MSVQAAPDAVAVATRRSPYQGLVPYTEADADWFFGRDEWREIIRASLRSYRISVLYGSSGVGKSSVLRAGLLRRLEDEARESLDVRGLPGMLPVVFGAWSLDDPLDALREAITGAAAQLGLEPAGEEQESLADALAAWPERVQGPLLLVLDQLEELFAYHDRPGDPMLEELAAALRSRDPAVHFLLSLREDSLAKLDRFKGYVPGLLDHLLRLEHLTREDARLAILAPVERWNETVAPGEQVEAEPAFVDSVLDQVAAGKVSLGDQGTGAVAGDVPSGIEAPYLQLVLDRVWGEEQRTGSSTLRLSTLDRLGGATEIVRTHLDEALAALPPREQDLAGRTFHHLVTPSGTKIALRVGDLAKYANDEEARLQPLVDELAGDARILRSAGDGRYEIYHDALAGPILDWTNRWEEREKRRRERRRMLVLGAVALVLAAIAAAIAVLAIQARQAQHAARRDQSRALAAQVVATADSDPPAALATALQAEKASPTREAEGALRVALASDLRRRTLRGHTKSVNSAVFSPDGKRILSASADGTARIWDAATGESLRTLRGHGKSVDSAVYSRDGKHILTVGNDGTARVWDAATGKSLYTLKADDADFSPDGKHILAVSDNGTVRTWEVANGHRLNTLKGKANSAAYSRDGKRVVTADSDDFTARVWDAATGTSLRTLKGHTDSVYSAAFSRNGKRIVTVSDDFTARVWDAATGKSLHTLKDTDAAAFSPDGNHIVSTSGEFTAKIWDVDLNWGFDNHILAHADYVETAAFSPDGKFVVTTSDDGTARIWGAATGHSLETFTGHTGPVNSAGLSPDGELLVTASDDRTVRVWDANADHTLRSFLGPVVNWRSLTADAAVSSELSSASFSPDGKRIVTAGAISVVRFGPKAKNHVEGTAWIWDAATGRKLHTVVTGRTDTVSGSMFSPNGKKRVVLGSDRTVAAFSPDSRRIVTASVDRTVSIWDAATGNKLHALNTGHVNSAAFSPDGKLVLTAGSDGATRIWDAVTGGKLDTFTRNTGPVYSAAFSPDGTLVVTANEDRTSRIWDVDTGRNLRTLTGHTAPVNSAAFSPDGTLIVTAGSDGTARIWDTDTGRNLHTFVTGQADMVTSAAFSRDGKLVVTASGDGTARIWDVATGHSVETLVGHSDFVNSAAFSPDGKRVVTSSLDGTARTWRCELCGVPVERMIALAHERMNAR